MTDRNDNPHLQYSKDAYAPCKLCNTQRPRTELDTINSEGLEMPPVEVCRDEKWCKAQQVRGLEEAHYDQLQYEKDRILTHEEARREGSDQ